MPEQLLTLFVVGATSLLGFFVVRRRLGLSMRSVGVGLIRTVETIGAGVVFLSLNLVVGIVLLMAARLLLERIVPLYPLGDLTMLVLSFVQGLAFECCRRLSRCS